MQLTASRFAQERGEGMARDCSNCSRANSLLTRRRLLYSPMPSESMINKSDLMVEAPTTTAASSPTPKTKMKPTRNEAPQVQWSMPSADRPRFLFQPPEAVQEAAKLPRTTSRGRQGTCRFKMSPLLNTNYKSRLNSSRARMHVFPLLIFIVLINLIGQQTSRICSLAAAHSDSLSSATTEAAKGQVLASGDGVHYLDGHEQEELLASQWDPKLAPLVRQAQQAHLDYQVIYAIRGDGPAGGEHEQDDWETARSSHQQSVHKMSRRQTGRQINVSSSGGGGGQASNSKPSQQPPQSQSTSTGQVKAPPNPVLGHYNRTNAFIRAFNYKFRLDLELNNNLFGPNLMQNHLLPNGARQISVQKLENCYYHARTRPDVRPVAVGAFRTCNGLSGIIHVNNESFVIHPLYQPDASKKHPHIVYRYQNGRPTDGECGNSGLHEWALRHFSQPLADFTQAGQQQQTGGNVNNNNNNLLSRFSRETTTKDDCSENDGVACNAHRMEKRDVSLTEKYIELALILSQDVFDKRNSSSRLEVVHDAIQIINCVDLYFRSAMTRVSIVYIETWAHGDQIEIGPDVKQTLYNLLDYSTRRLYKISMDALHLLTGGHSNRFDGQKVGISIPGSICSSKAISLSQEASVFEPFVAAASMAHMLGHNLGMEHDEDVVQSAAGSDQATLDQSSRTSTAGQQAQQQQSAESRSFSLSSVPTTRRPAFQTSTTPASIEMDNNEHEDEIKSRSVSSRGAREQVTPVGCQTNCLMSEHLVYLEPPVSFGNIIQINSTLISNNNNIDEDQQQHHHHHNQQQQQNTFAIQQEPQRAGHLQPAFNSSTSTSSSSSGDQRQSSLTADETDLFDLELSEAQLLKAGLPFRFSRQSVEAYNRVLRSGRGICLFNRPNQLEDFKNCGNGIVDEGEQCDCGRLRECLENDSCCDPRTCRFKVEAQCTSGACCDRCRFRPRGFVCRRPRGECDLHEQCSGQSNHCPPDVYKQNGQPCGNGQGYCFLGQCPSHDAQCADLWGADGRSSSRLCYSSFNLNGTRLGNCGLVQDTAKVAQPRFKRCDHQNMMCGTLQCQLGNMEPLTADTGGQTGGDSGASSSYEYSNKTLYASDGRSHNCKVIISGISGQTSARSSSGQQQQQIDSKQTPSGGSISYVRDGTKCAPNKVCFNKTCQPVESVYRETFELCPRDERGRFCSNNGVCSTANRCHCNDGWLGHDCSQPAPEEPPPAASTSTTANLQEPANLQQQQPQLTPIGSLPILETATNLLHQIQQQQQLHAGQYHQVASTPGQSMSFESLAGNSSLATSSRSAATTEQSLIGLPTAASGAELVTTALPELLPPTSPTPDTSLSAATVANPTAGATAVASPSNASSTIQVQDKKKHDALGAPTLVFILVSIVAAVYVGFALMANCYRRKGLLKPDKVLRHHQMNCKLDALRSSLIAKRLAGAESGALATAFDGLEAAEGHLNHHHLPNGGSLVDMMSPFVSPLSAQSSGQNMNGPPGQAPAPPVGPGMFPNNNNNNQQMLEPSELQQQQQQGLFGQPYATNQSANLHRPHHHHQQQQQQQQPQQIQANVHYFNRPVEPVDCPHQQQQQQQQQQSQDPYGVGYPETGSGDHIPLLLGDQHRQVNQHSKRRPFNQRLVAGQQQPLSSFANYGRGAPLGYLPPPPPPLKRTRPPVQPTAKGPAGGYLAQLASGPSNSQPLNRAISLGSVSHRHHHLSNDRLNYYQQHHLNDPEDEEDEEDLVDDRDADEAARHADAVRRALATPSKQRLRPGGRQSMSIDRRAMMPMRMAMQMPPEDSCSVPSSPEHREPYWSDAESRATRRLGGQPPIDGYHEDVLLGLMSQADRHDDYRQSRRSIGGGGSRRQLPTKQQRSFEQPQPVGDQLMDEDDLPPPPPPPPPQSGASPESNPRQPNGGDESERDDEEADEEELHRRPDSVKLRALDSFKLANNASNNMRGPNHQVANQHENLSLIAQLQQLEQMQSLHQKEVASELTKRQLTSGNTGGGGGGPEVGLHEFFSLPLSVQLSALLARSLADQSSHTNNNQQHHQQQATPIDEYLNTLNSTNVAKSSRQHQPQAQQQQQQPQQTRTGLDHYPQANQSTRSSMSRQQMKLQNLQGLINRLQKLHQQTALQQQLDELNGRDESSPLGLVDRPGPGEPTTVTGGGNSRHSTLGRKSSSHRNYQTNDDLYEVKSRQLESRGRRVNARRAASRSGQATGGGACCGDAATKNESVYSMSDSEDGAYMSRVLASYGRPAGAPPKPPAQADPQEPHSRQALVASNPNQASRELTDSKQRPAESTTPTISTDVSSHMDSQNQQQPPLPPTPPPPPPADDDDEARQGNQ